MRPRKVERHYHNAVAAISEAHTARLLRARLLSVRGKETHDSNVAYCDCELAQAFHWLNKKLGKLKVRQLTRKGKRK